MKKTAFFALLFLWSTSAVYADRRLAWNHSGKGVDDENTQVTSYEVAIVRPGNPPSGGQSPQKLFGVAATDVCSADTALIWTCQQALTETFAGLDDGTYEVYVRARGGRLADGTLGDLPSDWAGPLTVTIADNSSPTPSVDVPPQPPSGLTVVEDVEPEPDPDPVDPPPVGTIAGQWIQTGGQNSTTPTTGIFSTINGTIETSNTETNIHAMFVPNVSSPVTLFEGEMHVSGGEGIGVVFRSQWPDSNEYLRLRRTSSAPTFHLWHRGALDTGLLSTGVASTPDTWFSFRMEITGTTLRVKVWKTGDPVPTEALEQILSFDPTGKAVGIWSMGPGTKSWRNLSIGGSLITLP